MFMVYFKLASEVGLTPKQTLTFISSKMFGQMFNCFSWGCYLEKHHPEYGRLKDITFDIPSNENIFLIFNEVD